MITLLGLASFIGGLVSFLLCPSYAGVGLMLVGLAILNASLRKA